MARNTRVSHPADDGLLVMPSDDFPTDPNAETVGLPSDDSGKGSVPEPGKFTTAGMPTEIGRYKILGIIASGGMGVVYEAMQEAPRRRVALKVIKAGAASEMALRRFDFEAQILAKLRHPNIAQIYEAGTWESEQGPAPFFAMEYIPGRQPLIDHAQKSNLSLKERLELFIKICDAVHHGHQKGVIHRDLKPDNILIDSSGEPKIIDFGVARATDADLAVTTMQTTMGQLIGTLQYMSPEQCDADPDRIDTRSDVYALGVIMFQLLSGKLPYDLRRQAIHEAIRVIKEQRPDSMSTINMTLKGDVNTITMKALEKERDRRYQSAAELSGDIHHFLNSEPIIARPLSMSYQLTLFTKKYKRTCAAVLLLVVSIILGLFGTIWGMVEANRQTTIAQTQTVLAEDRYKAIFDMANGYIQDFYSGIVKLNAAMDVRRLVLDETLKHLTSLQNSSQSNHEVEALIAYTHSAYGQYFASLRSANVLDTQQAIVHLNISVQIFEELVNSGNPEHGRSLALAQYRISDVKKILEEYDSCLKKLDEATTVIEQFVQKYPDNESGHRLFAAIEMSRVDVLNETGRIDEAKKQLDQIVGHRRTRALGSPKNLQLQRNFANFLLRAGRISVKFEKYDIATEHYEEAMAIFTELVALEPENGRATRDKAWCHYFLGETFLLRNMDDAGFENLDAGLVIIRERCVANPTAADARNDIVRYLGGMSGTEYIWFCDVTNQLDRARASCREILLALQPVVEASPDNYALSKVFSTVEEYLGQIEAVVSADSE